MGPQSRSGLLLLLFCLEPGHTAQFYVDPISTSFPHRCIQCFDQWIDESWNCSFVVNEI
jgi:hypothetical protein